MIAVRVARIAWLISVLRVLGTGFWFIGWLLRPGAVGTRWSDRRVAKAVWAPGGVVGGIDQAGPFGDPWAGRPRRAACSAAAIARHTEPAPRHSAVPPVPSSDRRRHRVERLERPRLEQQLERLDEGPLSVERAGTSAGQSLDTAFENGESGRRGLASPLSDYRRRHGTPQPFPWRTAD